VFLVNQTRSEVLGERAFRRLEDLPTAVELVALAVPMPAIDASLDGALASGAKAVLVVSAGFAEAGEAGRAAQDEMVAKIRAAGAVLVGPNCLGVIDNTTDLELAWMGVLGGGSLPTGPVAVVSQSGTVASEFITLGQQRGLGISRFVSVGNQADLTIADFVSALVDHEETRVIAIYCEEFRAAREMFDAIHAATTAGKVVILLAATGEIGARAALSHTGALTSDAAVIDAASRAAGAHLVSGMQEMLDVAELAVKLPRPRGRRVGMVSDGGGQAVLGGEILQQVGLEVVQFSRDLRDRLKTALDPSATTSNPVDLAKSNTNPDGFHRAVELVSASGEVDAIFMTGGFGSFAVFDPSLREPQVQLARETVAAAARRGLPLIIHTYYLQSESLLAARDAGAPCVGDIVAAARAYARIIDALEAPKSGVPPLPTAIDERAARGGYFEARELLVEAGVSFPPAQRVRNLEDALAAAAEIGYPVALKAVDLNHKSDLGGVALGITEPRRFSEAFVSMQNRVVSETFSVEAMVDLNDSLEFIVGCRRDPQFGPILLVGLGGVFAEVFRDVALALAPTSTAEVDRMIRGLKTSPLFSGARGRLPLAIGRVAETAATLSRVMAERPWISDLEINPLLVGHAKAVAVDARMLVDSADGVGDETTDA
jgi:acyl-CoA synthetase (NDP forming)